MQRKIIRLQYLNLCWVLTIWSTELSAAKLETHWRSVVVCICSNDVVWSPIVGGWDRESFNSSQGVFIIQ